GRNRSRRWSSTASAALSISSASRAARYGAGAKRRLSRESEENPMREYMERLRARGELLEVHRPVDPKHELAAVTDAAHERWGKPILFHIVRGTGLPVLTNISGSRARLAEIIGIGPDEFCRQWNNLATIAGSRDIPVSVAAADDIAYVEA